MLIILLQEGQVHCGQRGIQARSGIQSTSCFRRLSVCHALGPGPQESYRCVSAQMCELGFQCTVFEITLILNAESILQSINQPTNQSVSPSISQSVNHSINQSGFTSTFQLLKTLPQTGSSVYSGVCQPMGFTVHRVVVLFSIV